MTRRVRFSPLLTAGVLTAAIAAAALEARASDVPFTAQPPISTAADGAFFVTSADVDGDGDLDVLSTSYYSDTVAWHENTAGNGTAWTFHVISTAAAGAHSVRAADVDGDGDLDVLSASPFDDKVAWYENTAGNGSAWTLRTISTSADGARAVFAADVDGDGDLDVLSASAFDDKIAWYENTAGNGSAWTLRTISTSADAAFFVVAADVDGDGDLDVLSGSVNDDKVAWYENTAGNGTAWTARTISTAADGVRSVFAADVDGDGDVDALSASRDDDTVAWYENSAGNGTAWVLHTVSTAGNGARSVVAADVDGDGDLDVLSASSYDNAVAWDENVSGNGSAWIHRTISTAAAVAITVAAADLDRDGDLDVLSASAIDDKIAWYRNDTIHESACFAPASAIGPVASGAASIAGADLDGDGDTDALAALAGSANRVEWQENTAGDGSVWSGHFIESTINLAAAAISADVDGDGDLDALSVGYYSPLRWHRNETGAGTTWTNFPIGANGFSLAAADVDGDGDLDALSTTNFFDPVVKWYENTAGNGSAWSFRTIAMMTMGGPGFGIAAADLDGDGDADVVSSFSSGPTPAVLWFENTTGTGSSWTTRTVSASEGRQLSPADVDGDGDLDVVVGGFSGLFWHENTNGAATAWAAHTVANGSYLSATTADLDADGDIDVMGNGTPSGVVWVENTSGDGSAWSVHNLSGASGAGVAAADVNGDGELDVLLASSTANRLDWFEHRGGQFSLAVSDTAPAGAINNELVSMLTVVATHNGRAGDGDLELARLGLLFEEAPGDPLTSAEANAVIESLQIYRDANGSGSFEPATDVLVTQVLTLALVNGVQTVTFTDGDPGVQVAFGTPRTYFVVTQLTSNASQQTPNQFRVTHLGLGPSASAAEDRTYDIPLRPACPADVSSSVLGPITPVELLGFDVE
jgi:uncharacterized membrane protein (DUF2068 family)